MRQPSEWLKELDGFKAGDRIRAGGKGTHMGIIRHLLRIPGYGCRAHVYWPTIPFECEGWQSPASENFVDLDRLTRVEPYQVGSPPIGEQLALL